ncbi:MAG: hypothetical protein IPG97_12290 [Microthrixaceae bacterium]|jgi:predicted  nucleic acid-binding Zn-ribbon protein|nr:hypothetical protein [Microthrixaceae bacterium]
MTSADERIARLEAQIATLESEQRRLREKLTDAQVEQWQGRIEDLEVQSHLASLDAQDRLAPLREDLRNRWLDARAQLDHSRELTTDAIETIRDGVGSAVNALREAVLDSRRQSEG